MKKRIKLTDKELAIGMWVYICLYIESYDTEDEDYEQIIKLKQNWLKEHYKHNKANCTVNLGPYWWYDCWLCNKYYDNNCLDCPLQSCATGSLYDTVVEYYYNKDKQSKALESAKKILGIIQKEVEDEDN